MTCTLPDPRVCILNATFSRTFNSACFESDNVEFQIFWFCFSQLLQSHLQHHPPRLPFPISPLICQPSALMGELWWWLNLLSCCLCGLCVLRYESWPLKANASQAASECTWQLLSGLLIHRWRGKCKITVLIFMIYTYIHTQTQLVLHGSARCWCACAPVFVLENRSLICLNRYSLVTAGVTVLWLGTWFVLVLSTVVYGWFAVQHACVGTYLCVSAVLYHAGELRCKLGSKYTRAGKDDSLWKHSCSYWHVPAYLAFAFLWTEVACFVY